MSDVIELNRKKASPWNKLTFDEIVSQGKRTLSLKEPKTIWEKFFGVKGQVSRQYYACHYCGSVDTHVAKLGYQRDGHYYITSYEKACHNCGSTTALLSGDLD